MLITCRCLSYLTFILVLYLIRMCLIVGWRGITALDNGAHSSLCFQKNLYPQTNVQIACMSYYHYISLLSKAQKQKDLFCGHIIVNAIASSGTPPKICLTNQFLRGRLYYLLQPLRISVSWISLDGITTLLLVFPAFYSFEQEAPGQLRLSFLKQKLE